jgi:hypothetical protein
LLAGHPPAFVAAPGVVMPPGQPISHAPARTAVVALPAPEAIAVLAAGRAVITA